MILAVIAAWPAPAFPIDDAVVTREFIFEQAPFAASHAATIAEAPAGPVAAWYGGSREGARDVGIWVARWAGAGWSSPQRVTGCESDDGSPLSCWNPVLFQPRSGPLQLFYKAGPDPRRWWGLRRISRDGGEHWEPAERLPDGIIGPTRNPPVELASGVILSPSSDEHDGWKLFIERSVDHGAHWQRIGPLPGADRIGAIQPALLVWPGGRVQLLARSREGRIVASISNNAGLNWSDLEETGLPNPNSGIAAVMLRDGRALLVYNPSRWRRSPLAVAISNDGEHWHDALTLEQGWGEYSYPSVIQSADGLVHIVYTWKRERIRHVVIDPARLRR